MMIGVRKGLINDIPTLTVVEHSKENEKLPLVVNFHGITSAKEHNLDFAFLLAEKGFRVILPDSLHHGEREFNISTDERNIAFWDIVFKNLKDLETIKAYVEENNLLLNERIAVAGTSMGGITTAAALTQFEWIKSAVIFMGTPKALTFGKQLVESYRSIINIPEEEMEKLFKQLEKIDLSMQLNKLNDRPLFLWHGDKDHVVPFDHTYSFYQTAKEQYKNPNNIHFIREENREHKVSRIAKLEAVKWLEKHL